MWVTVEHKELGLRARTRNFRGSSLEAKGWSIVDDDPGEEE